MGIGMMFSANFDGVSYFVFHHYYPQINLVYNEVCAEIIRNKNDPALHAAAMLHAAEKFVVSNLFLSLSITSVSLVVLTLKLSSRPEGRLECT